MTYQARPFRNFHTLLFVLVGLFLILMFPRVLKSLFNPALDTVVSTPEARAFKRKMRRTYREIKKIEFTYNKYDSTMSVVIDMGQQHSEDEMALAMVRDIREFILQEETLALADSLPFSDVVITTEVHFDDAAYIFYSAYYGDHVEPEIDTTHNGCKIDLFHTWQGKVSFVIDGKAYCRTFTMDDLETN